MPNNFMPDPRRYQTGARPAARGIGVVLVDQIPLFRDGLSSMVTHTPGLRWLGSTQNVHAAVVMSERLRPDVIVIDSALDPRGHLTRMLTSSTEAPTVLVTVRDPHRTSQYVAELLEAGANGILLRSAEPGQITDAIRRSHVERRYLDPSLSTLAKSLRTKSPGVRQPLSRREYQVLQLIADGLENQAIAKALFVSVETVRTHVKSILRKLHARDRAHAVAIAFRLGVLVAHGDGSFPHSTNGSVPTTARSLRAARA